MAKDQSPHEMLRELMRPTAALGAKARIAKLTPEGRRALARRTGRGSGAARRAKATAKRGPR